jgi:hypothetical protein
MQRIEKEHFAPPPLPSFSSSSSSSINKPCVLTSIHKDVGKEGKKKMETIDKSPWNHGFPETKLGERLCTANHLPSNILEINPSYDCNDFKKIGNGDR